jgi:hypothetical protein
MEFLNFDNKTRKWILALSGLILLLISANGYLFYSKSKKDVEIKKVIVKNIELEKELNDIKIEYENIKANFQDLNGSFAAKEAGLNAKIARLEKALRNSGGNMNSAELKKAKQEIAELQSSIQSYSNEINDLKAENKDLSSLNSVLQTTIEETNKINETLADENEDLTQKVKLAAMLKASIITTNCFERKKNNKFEITEKAKDVAKVVSEIKMVSNDLAPEGTYIVFMQLLGPSGSLMTAPRQSGDKEELIINGKKIEYTTSSLIIYSKNNNTYSTDWINSENWKPGTYTVNLYTKDGVMGSGTFVLKK